MTWHISYIGIIFLLMLFIPNFLWTKRMPKDYYRSMLGIPLPGATLPVVAFALLSIYECYPILFVSVLILGIGHIGIHWNHFKEASAEDL